jgi:hypothetical protein
MKGPLLEEPDKSPIMCISALKVSIWQIELVLVTYSLKTQINVLL